MTLLVVEGFEPNQELWNFLVRFREEVAETMRQMVFPLREQYGLSIISNEEEAERKGKALVKFYSELTAAGIDPKDALPVSQIMFATPSDVLKEHFAKELRDM